MKNIFNKWVLLGVLFFGAQTAWAGGNNCTANFTYTVETEISSFTYQFTDMSSSVGQIVSWNWDFDDGFSSENQNPEHQYFTEGTYVVSLSILCSDGSSDIISDTIKVEEVVPPYCAASFTYTVDTSQASYSYQFTDHSVSPNDTITSWSWNFGDGSAIVHSQNPLHQYSSTGSYTVSLSISTISGCNSSFSDVVVASMTPPSCNAYFTYSADSVTGNNQLIFFFDQSTAADPIISWHWDFADGDSAVVKNPVHIFPSVGVYDVVLTIKTQNGCTSTVHYPIQVGNPQKYNLWGRVYLGNLTTDKCIALLYKEFNNGYILPIDTVRLTSVSDTLGVYYFYQILEGKHKVKILLPESSAYDKLYAPTYYGNNLFWNSSSVINLNQDLALMNVNMIPIVQQGGSCMISGSIMQNNTPIQYEGVQVLLLNSSHDVYAYTFTDNQGNYKFEDVPTGNYLIYAEVTGLYAIPAHISFISTHDTLSNVNIHLSTKNTFISIDPTINKEAAINIKLFPNPVDDYLNIRINGTHTDLNYYIINNLGQYINEGLIPTNASLFTIGVNHIKSGFYILKVYSKDNTLSSSKKFIRR